VVSRVLTPNCLRRSVSLIGRVLQGKTHKATRKRGEEGEEVGRAVTLRPCVYG